MIKLTETQKLFATLERIIETQQNLKPFHEQKKRQIQYALSCLIECGKDFQEEVNRQRSSGKNAVYLELSVSEFMAEEMIRNCKVIHQRLEALHHVEKLFQINLGACIKLLDSVPDKSKLKEELA